MKRLIALFIAILALIAGAGRTEVTVTSDCTPVSVEITEEQESTAETPAEAAVSPVLPLEDNTTIDADPCETEPETTDFAPLSEPVEETVTESAAMPTEEKEMPDNLSSAGDPPIEPVTETESGDGGDRVTAETDTEKKNETAVTETQDMPEAVVEPEPAAVPEYIPDPVIVPNEPTVETSPADETDAEQHGGNAPVFIDPCQGGPNPFDDGTPTEINDHNSDEFVGDGDRPGEGIHF